ncbi:phospholipase A and acyltransferase 3-like isoform X2 [Rhineura floridana]|uniref:phospholipase A and acyltransferase 3-like isoform X2 n=1 Tax=Rhineura floridana TaxID=261503 RepID=UPI002AC80517|nr:phospholipase A and acyltransferase 3-like isoform X2 [Rhineura floridana]
MKRGMTGMAGIGRAIQAVINVYTSQQQPRRGDMVQFQRSGYQHWGIYVGNGNVIHFTLPDWDCVRQDVIGGQTLLATVQRDRLADVAGRDPYAVHNQFDGDGEHPPLDPDVIVQMAEDLLGLQLPYNLLTSNCEHFATMMRYGVPQSGQTQTLQDR